MVLEALKLIELMSFLNLEDFQLNQWIFLVDSIPYSFNEFSVRTGHASRKRRQIP